MNLPRQLLLASLLLLSLPWAGCQFVREMEGAMRDGQVRSLLATARAVAAGLAAQPALLYPEPGRRQAAEDAPAWYAAPMDAPIIVDGYSDGWERVTRHRLSAAGLRGSFAIVYQAATWRDQLYLLLHVTDNDRQFYHPQSNPRANGDRLLLQTGDASTYTLLTAAPGAMQSHRVDARGQYTRDRQVRGFWQEARGGYTLELALPLASIRGRLGFTVVDAHGAGQERELGIMPATPTASPPWLVVFPETLTTALAAYAGPGIALQVVDRQHWLIGQVEAPAVTDTAPAEPTFWLLRWLYRRILEPPPDRSAESPDDQGRHHTPEINAALSGRESQAWYRSNNTSGSATLAATAPIRIREDGAVIGAVQVTQSSETYLSLTDSAVSRLLAYSFWAVGLSILALLAFGGVVSWRIRRLSAATAELMRQDGRLEQGFPRSQRADEIGELSRRYADLIDRLREYHDYLRGLSRKLSHELRTPLAVIQSSLEHLERTYPTGSDVYVARAKVGLNRLVAILSAMGEATRLEESIDGNDTEPFDLAALLGELVEAYRGVYPEHRFALNGASHPAPMLGTPELIAQLLDKLVSNAVSFTPPGALITLSLRQEDDERRLAVANPGPPLPKAMHPGQLFDSMVSVRPPDAKGIHLGLGLHIARLIADFHGGRLDAENLPDGTGVRFSVTLPRAEQQVYGLVLQAPRQGAWPARVIFFGAAV